MGKPEISAGHLHQTAQARRKRVQVACTQINQRQRVARTRGGRKHIGQLRKACPDSSSYLIAQCDECVSQGWDSHCASSLAGGERKARQVAAQAAIV